MSNGSSYDAMFSGIIGRDYDMLQRMKVNALVTAVKPNLTLVFFNNEYH